MLRTTSKEWLRNTASRVRAPVFRYAVENVKFLENPTQFFNNVLSMISSAEERLTIAALYIAADTPRARQVVDEIDKSLGKRPALRISLLLDRARCTRPSRDGPTIAESLSELVTKHGQNRLRISLFTPPPVPLFPQSSVVPPAFLDDAARETSRENPAENSDGASSDNFGELPVNYSGPFGILGWRRGVAFPDPPRVLLPPRVDEALGVQHCKGIASDHSRLLITGANLAGDYYEKREDRWSLWETPTSPPSTATTPSTLEEKAPSALGEKAPSALGEKAPSALGEKALPLKETTAAAEVGRNGMGMPDLWGIGGSGADSLPGFVHSLADALAPVSATIGPAGALFEPAIEPSRENVRAALLSLERASDPLSHSDSGNDPFSTEENGEFPAGNNHPECGSSDEAVVEISPALQLGPCAVVQDSAFLASLVASAASMWRTQITIASAYMNASQTLVKTLSASRAKYGGKLGKGRGRKERAGGGGSGSCGSCGGDGIGIVAVTASPRANAFFGSRGATRAVPWLYRHLAHRFAMETGATVLEHRGFRPPNNTTTTNNDTNNSNNNVNNNEIKKKEINNNKINNQKGSNSGDVDEGCGVGNGVGDDADCGRGSFHGKGIWVDAGAVGSVVGFGSGNFGRRSEERDMEMNFYASGPSGFAGEDRDRMLKDCDRLGRGAGEGMGGGWHIPIVAKWAKKFL